MLAKAPLNISEFIELGSKSASASPLIHVFSARLPSNRHPRRRFDCGFSGGGALKCSKTRVLIRAGYSRKPMETPGAYQLIDDETGEKFIVWGGIDDDDSPIPSKEVLSWKPNRMVPRNESSGGGVGGGGVGQIATVSQTDDSTKLHRGAGGSFSRLKAQKVRALSKKVSHNKQENAGNDYLHTGPKDASSCEWSSLESEHEFVEKKRDIAPIRNKGSISRAYKSQEAKNAILGTEAMPSLDSTKTNAELGSEYTSAEPNEHEFEKDKSDVLGSRAAVNASFRGWNSGMPIQNSMFNSTNQFKQDRKITSDSGFFSRKSFRDLGCIEEVIESLKAQLFVRPSHIQALAFAPVVSGKSCIIADQSGSGKTLAYIAPVIQHLRQEELQGLSKSSSRCPRAVILVPTAELASQVLSNCRSMSKCGVPFRSMVATGGFRQRTQLEGLQQDLDVLIATPGRFTFLLKEGFLQLTNLKCAVLDEVDILFGDEDFEQVLQSLVNSAPVTTQYLFATATLPVDIYNKLVEIFPDCEVIMGPGMHRTSSGLEEVLIDCSGDDGTEKTPETAFLNKKSALLQLVAERPVSKTIIFCNKIETCRKVENILKRYDRKGIQMQVLPFHSALDQETRLLNIKEFLNYKSKENSLFLICTDRASRGIDFTGVDHVVLFDFPRDPSEYVRRVGRTARGAGGKGKAFVFVVGKQVALASRIMERNKKGHPIHDVPSAYGLIS